MFLRSTVSALLSLSLTIPAYANTSISTPLATAEPVAINATVVDAQGRVLCVLPADATAVMIPSALRQQAEAMGQVEFSAAAGPVCPAQVMAELESKMDPAMPLKRTDTAMLGLIVAGGLAAVSIGACMAYSELTYEAGAHLEKNYHKNEYELIKQKFGPGVDTFAKVSAFICAPTSLVAVPIVGSIVWVPAAVVFGVHLLVKHYTSPPPPVGKK